MKELTKEAVLKAVKECYWRNDSMGVPICSGECLPCEKVIFRGSCEAIRELIIRNHEVEK